MEGVLPHQSKNKRQFLHFASRQLKLAEDGTAVGGRCFRTNARMGADSCNWRAPSFSSGRRLGPRPLGATAPVQDLAFILAIGSPRTEVRGSPKH